MTAMMNPKMLKPKRQRLEGNDIYRCKDSKVVDRTVRSAVEKIEESDRLQQAMRGDADTKNKFHDVVEAARDHEDIERVDNRPWYILDPRSPNMARWDLVTSLALILTIVMAPVEVGFLPAPETATDPLFIVNRLVDLVFVVDIIVSFFIMFKVEKGHYTSLLGASLLWETRLSKTAMNYTKGWCLIDVASVLPSIFDFSALRDSGGDDIVTVYDVNGTQSTCTRDAGKSAFKVLRMIRILRLFKLMRLLRASRLYSRFERRNTMPYSYISFIAVISQVLTICHWFTCILGMLSLASESPLDSWQAKFGLCTPGEPAVDCAGDRTVVCVEPAEMYIKTFYWALGLITGFSPIPARGPFDSHFAFGDKSTFTTIEVGTIIVIALVASAAWAYVTGVVVDLIAHFDPDKTAFQKQMDELNRFVKFYGIERPHAMQLREYFHETREVMRMRARYQVVEALSPLLRQRTSWTINKRWLVCVSFFKSSEMPFLAQVAMALEHVVYVPGDRPEMPRLYVIFKGTVKYMGHILGPGSTFGERDVLLCGPEVLYIRACCKTYVHANFLLPSRLFELATEFPVAMKNLKKHILREAFRREMHRLGRESRRLLLRKAKNSVAPETSQFTKLVKKNALTNTANGCERCNHQEQRGRALRLNTQGKPPVPAVSITDRSSNHSSKVDEGPPSELANLLATPDVQKLFQLLPQLSGGTAPPLPAPVEQSRFVARSSSGRRLQSLEA